MEYRQMGKTGLQLSTLSFGSWVTFHKQIDDQVADELMGIAYDEGINFFDNAEVYAAGESEKMMGRVLSKKKWDRTSIVLSSKAYFGWRGKQNKPNQTGLSRKHLTEACHEALQRLQTDYLDLYFCHRPDKNTPIAEVVQTMNTLIQQGKILYWGTSEWSGVEIMEAHRIAESYRLIGPAMEQPQYNLFERKKMEDDYIHLFKYEGMGTTIWSPLSSGLLTGKYLGEAGSTRLSMQGMEWLQERNITPARIEKVKALKNISDSIDVSLSLFSLAWCLKNPNVSTAILGASKVSQLEENLKALDVVEKLTDEIMQQVDAVMQNKPLLAEF